jgi:pSer/pThr/pTyr-binding forkhead associated (FHA) protein
MFVKLIPSNQNFQIIEIKNDEVIEIGRSIKLKYSINNNMISSSHCKIILNENKVKLLDLR